MSFVVRNVFPYKNKYFDCCDNEKQQLTDYIMHSYVAGQLTCQLSGSFSLQDVNEIKQALDNSDLFDGNITVEEKSQETPAPIPPGEETSSEPPLIETYRVITMTQTIVS